jgi:hypothetical protein
MIYLLNILNGRIRLKVEGFKESCDLMNINYIEPNYVIELNSAYLSGLIDTDGSIVYNEKGNRIDVLLEFKENKYTSKLDITQVIPNTTVKVYRLLKRNQTAGKIFNSIRFSYQTVDNMLNIYNYILKNRLYSDIKFYRVMKIKKFLELRSFKNYNKNTTQYEIFIKFMREYMLYMNEQKELPEYLKK